MQLPLTSLQPDADGMLNISQQFARAFEPVMDAVGDNTANRTTKNINYTIGNKPVIAREAVVANRDDDKNTPRIGPISIPFVRHLFGQNLGAFCADNSVIPVIGDAANYGIGAAVGVYDCDTTLYIPKVKLIYQITEDVLLYGVIKGVIENDAKRTYRGITGLTDDTIYLMQIFGTARALVKDGDSVAVGAFLAWETGDQEVGLKERTDETAVAFNMGASLAVTTPAGYSSNLVFILLGQSAGSSTDWSQVAFGYTITAPRTININAGKISTFSIDSDSVTLANTEDTHYVWVRRKLSDDTFVFQSGTTWPTNDETYKYYVLHSFDVDSEGNASLDKIQAIMNREQIDVAGSGLAYQVFQINSAGTAIEVDWLRAGASYA